MPVGFALAYYLIGAVLLDLNAGKLHKMTARGQNMLIGDVSSIPEAVKREVHARRYLYWTMLGRYLLFHVWSLAVSSILLWVFDSTKDSTILFLAYVGAYTGLLWYQVFWILSMKRILVLIFDIVYQDFHWPAKPQATHCSSLYWYSTWTTSTTLLP
jgi:uncharacterized membrane protein